jgi:hypothetical protein
MTDMNTIWLNNRVNPDELEKSVKYMADKMAAGMEPEEAISWAAIRYAINVVRLRHELKERGMYKCPTA